MLLFHLKSSFRSQDFQTFVLTFWSCRKKRLIIKLKLILKFMTSQPGQQTIAIHIFLNVSWIKDNWAIKFGQLQSLTIEIVLIKNNAEKKAGRRVPDLFLLFEKALYEVKANGLEFSFSIFWYSATCYIKTNFKTLDYWSRDLLNSSFLEKGLGIVSAPHFVFDFLTKMFLMF